VHQSDATTADGQAGKAKTPQNVVHWTTERLDEGRMLLVRISMDAATVRREVAARLADLGRRAPPKGFRSGRVSESVLRKLHGKKVLHATRNDLMGASFDAVIEQCRKQGIEVKGGGQITPSNIVFSETEGLKYEVLLAGLEPQQTEKASRSDVVDLRK